MSVEIHYVEDDLVVLASLGRMLQSLTGLPVRRFSSVASYAAAAPFSGQVMLVTDGTLTDGTCDDVISYAVKTYIPASRLGATALIYSGDPSSAGHITRAIALCVSNGLSPHFVQKGHELTEWWQIVRPNFLP